MLLRIFQLNLSNIIAKSHFIFLNACMNYEKMDLVSFQ